MHRKIGIALVLSVLMVAFIGGSTAGVPSAAAEDGGALCNGPDLMTVLVLGTDQKNRSYNYGLADTIMLFRIDFRSPSVTVMGIPRDMWVYIPGIEDNLGVDHAKLNTAYLYGTEGMGYNPEAGGGAGLMKMTLEENWGLEIDHTAVMNMTVFADVVRAIGGIEVYNPSPIYSFHQKNKPKYPTGGYFFDGKDAQLYARWRDPRNELDRIDRQSILIKAICDSLFQAETVPHIPQLISAYWNNVVTDLSLAQLGQLLCLASKADQVDVTFTRIPEDELLGRRTHFAPLNVYMFNWVEKEEGRIEEIMTQFQEGTWPQDEGD